MKLLTDILDLASTNSMRSLAYVAAKRLWRSIESTKQYSTRFLQAGLLISMYELGHAIYPEASISVSRNARLGLELGINEFGGDRMNPSPNSWTEHEERTRTWWGSMILDRYSYTQDSASFLVVSDRKTDMSVSGSAAVLSAHQNQIPISLYPLTMPHGNKM
jgi:hypothetical protein